MARVKTAGAGAVSYGKKETLLSYMKRHKWMYLLMLPGIIYFVIFKYVPMAGVVGYIFPKLQPLFGNLGK